MLTTIWSTNLITATEHTTIRGSVSKFEFQMIFTANDQRIARDSIRVALHIYNLSTSSTFVKTFPTNLFPKNFCIIFLTTEIFKGSIRL